ncbi:GNAT family N-acetyltransferase [Bosea sp. 117]|uniref:GNAT family N-acetyltransferase n=1 Tax=Bosea sp. 117 TaxID=1125973 RepID=UPI000493EA2D|nr:GNAT family N-acetyltransferase [Bosea sp. 117]
MVYIARVNDLSGPLQTHSVLGRVSVHRSFAPAACAWRQLESEGLLTPYQHLDFVETWWREIGQKDNQRLLIAVGRGALDEPTFLWPLRERRVGPLVLAEPLGGKHASYHFGPWSPRVLAEGPAAISAAVAQFAAAAPHVDALILPRQVAEWRGHANPMVALSSSPSVSNAYRTRLEADPDAHMRRVMSHDARKQVRSKTRKFEALPGFRVVRASEPGEVDRLLDAFMRQKAERFAELGIANPFTVPGTLDFFRLLANETRDEPSFSFELLGLEAGGEVQAVMGGIGDGRRFSAMINSFAVEPHGRLTPGYVITGLLIADLCRRGYEAFDLGVGEARYKSQFCDETETLVDVRIPLTAAGRAYSRASQEVQRLKRTVKHTPALWSTVSRLRRVWTF